MCDLVKRALSRAMHSKKQITIVDDCYSDSAVVIAVGSDSVTVCDNTELIKDRDSARRCASIASKLAAYSFRRGDIKSGMRRGRMAARYHALAAKAVKNMSIRTIKFNDLIGFTV